MILDSALKIMGSQGYALLIEHGIETAQKFSDEINRRPHFQLITPPEINILTYRICPAEIQEELAGLTREWMEKFGEWKSVVRVHEWKPGAKAVWEVNVLKPGDYCVHLTYSGEGRLVWAVDIEGGEHIQNQQNSSHNYQRFPIGWGRPNWRHSTSRR